MITQYVKHHNTDLWSNSTQSCGRFCMCLLHINSRCSVEGAISVLGAETSRLMERWGHTHADYCIKRLECLWGQMCLEATQTGKDRLIGWKHKRGKGQSFLHHGAAMDRCQTQRQRGTWLVVSGKVKSSYSTIPLVLPETARIMFADNSTGSDGLCSQRRGYRVDSSGDVLYCVVFLCIVI